MPNGSVQAIEAPVTTLIELLCVIVVGMLMRVPLSEVCPGGKALVEKLPAHSAAGTRVIARTVMPGSSRNRMIGAPLFTNPWDGRYEDGEAGAKRGVEPGKESTTRTRLLEERFAVAEGSRARAEGV